MPDPNKKIHPQWPMDWLSCKVQKISKRRASKNESNWITICTTCKSSETWACYLQAPHSWRKIIQQVSYWTTISDNGKVNWRTTWTTSRWRTNSWIETSHSCSSRESCSRVTWNSSNSSRHWRATKRGWAVPSLWFKSQPPATTTSRSRCQPRRSSSEFTSSSMLNFRHCIKAYRCRLQVTLIDCNNELLNL